MQEGICVLECMTFGGARGEEHGCVYVCGQPELLLYGWPQPSLTTKRVIPMLVHGGKRGIFTIKALKL